MQFWPLTVRDVLDIALVAVTIYFFLRLIKGTKTVQMLMGLSIFVGIYEVSRYTGLLTVEWLYGHVFSSFIAILVVLFQHDIRRALMQIGVSQFFGTTNRGNRDFLDSLIESCVVLAQRGWGGLIVLEQDTGLRHLYDSGVEMSSLVRPDVMQAIFCPQAPMHDGAVIIHDQKIVAARVLLPMAQGKTVRGEFGTRHRAAVGLSEESDALIVVISEETHEMRLCRDGNISEPLDSGQLHDQLHHLLYGGSKLSSANGEERA